MEVRITFRSEIYLKGESMQEIREKFEGMNLFSKSASDNDVNFVDIDSVEDSESFKDLTDDWENDEWDEDEDDDDEDDDDEQYGHVNPFHSMWNSKW